MTISNIVVANSNMSVDLRDADKVLNDDACPILFVIMQMHQAH
jgi:hypothetical protein